MNQATRPHVSLIKRFVGLMLVITVLGIALVAALSLYEHGVDARKEAQAIAMDRALTVLDATETAATAESLSRFIYSTAAQPSIRAIAMLNANDEIVLASKHAWPGQRPDELSGTPLADWLATPARNQAKAYWDNPNHVAVVIAPLDPINPASSMVQQLADGRLVLALDATSFIAKSRTEAWFDAAWAGGIFLLIILVLARVLHRRVARPLQALYLQATRPGESLEKSTQAMRNAAPEMKVLGRAVDDLVATRRALDAEKERLSDIADTIPGAVYEYRHHDGADDEFTFVSAGILPLMGIKNTDVSIDNPVEVSRLFWSRVLPEDHSVIEEATYEANHPIAREWEVEFRIRTDSGIRWIWGHAVPVNDELEGQLFRGVLLDTTARKELEQRLQDAAIHDPLTGALNRAGMEPQLETSLAAAQRHGHPLSVMIFDIDHFKYINDTYGHPIGDAILTELVALIGGRLRGSDSFARWGGEEFLILLPHTDHDGAIRVAEDIRQAVQAHAFSHGETMTISLGVATAHTKDDDIELVRRADNRLYRAKALGRNRVEGRSHPESGVAS
ncbi:GGDEF domain-containing protein [Guyparkeria sp.]|uniref:GGDEF domain-containing protein n=1 Tax=Guyparkeria sp. TaxID=2035736 RepID=UPI003970D70A